jgi:hypothetical protein
VRSRPVPAVPPEVMGVGDDIMGNDVKVERREEDTQEVFG